jgi:hypothetical protein
VVDGRARVEGRWFGVRGLRFVRPALILTVGDRSERRLLAELDDKPWAAKDGESWRAMFAVESVEALERADRVELSVAPDVNVDLRTGGVSAEGPIEATARVSDGPPAVRAPAGETAPPRASGPSGETAPPRPSGPSGETAPPGPSAEAGPRAAAGPSDAPVGPATRRRRARGVPAAAPVPLVPEPAAAQPTTAEPAAPEGPPSAASAPAQSQAPPPAAPRPRPSQSRVADVERLTSKLRTAEAALEREQGRREDVEQSLERERAETRRTVAELARIRAELELARTAERASADTSTQLDASRRDNHELRARHEALRSDHERVLRARAELEETLDARTTSLQSTREELAGERHQRREAESRAAAAVEAAAESGHRPPVVHATPHPSLPRTARPLNPSLRQSPWLRLLVVIVIAGVLLAVYLVLHSTVLH